MKTFSVVFVIVALFLIEAAHADSVHLPFAHDSKLLDHASVVGRHGSVQTVITPTPHGFHVSARFSRQDSFEGMYMCSATEFRDKDGQLVAQVRQRSAVNASFFGKPKIQLEDRDVNMSYDQQARVAFLEIVQAECPVDTWKRLSDLSTVAPDISSAMLIMGIGF